MDVGTVGLHPPPRSGCWPDRCGLPRRSSCDGCCSHADAENSYTSSRQRWTLHLETRISMTLFEDASPWEPNHQQQSREGVVSRRVDAAQGVAQIMVTALLVALSFAAGWFGYSFV